MDKLEAIKILVRYFLLQEPLPSDLKALLDSIAYGGFFRDHSQIRVASISNIRSSFKDVLDSDLQDMPRFLGSDTLEGMIAQARLELGV